MEISNSHKVIFMHVQRTGGASVLSSLRSCGVWAKPSKSKFNKFITRLPVRRSPERIRFRGHDALAFVQRRLPAKVFASYTKVAFVRNPYSWLTSMYSTYKKGPNHRHHPRVAAMSGFPEYIDWEISRGKRFQDIFLLDQDGKLAIDFLGRFEQLEADYLRLCELLDVAGPPLPHRNQNRFKDYREFYDDETREKVADYWGRDLQLLGYDFEGNRLPCPLDELQGSA